MFTVCVCVCVCVYPRLCRYLELKTPDLLVAGGAPYEPYVQALLSAATALQPGKCLPWNCSVSDGT